MKSKKLIAVLSAASMLGSLVVAVPALADSMTVTSAGIAGANEGAVTAGVITEDTVSGTYTYTASGVSGVDDKYVVMIPLSGYTEGTNVSISIPYDVSDDYAVNSNGTYCFLRSYAGTTSLGNIGGARDQNSIQNAQAGTVVTKNYTVTLAEGSDGIGVQFHFRDITAGSVTVGPISVTYDQTVVPPTVVATNGETEYTDFATAISEAQDGDEIELLADVDLGNTRLDINAGISITGDGTKTITGNAAPAGILVTNGNAVTFEGVNIVASGNNNALAISKGNSNGKSDVTLIDSTVTGNIYHENGQGSFIALDNTQVDGSIYTRHASSGATYAGCAISLANGSTADAITYSSENIDTYPADSVSIDGTSDGGTITDIAVRYYTVTGETERSYDTLRITSTDGTATAALDSTITGENVSVAIRFFNIPYGAEINGITLE